MLSVRTGLLAIVLCFGFGLPGFAEDSPPPAAAGHAASEAPKAQAKKSGRKKTGSSDLTLAPSSAPSSVEAEKAARLAEGRKKFFEQSSGFDNGGAGGSPLSLGPSGTPAMGFKF